jgi:hypothetical protein
MLPMIEWKFCFAWCGLSFMLAAIMFNVCSRVTWFKIVAN